MYFKSNELTVIYNGNDERSKKLLAYAQTIAKKINHQDLSKTVVSPNLFGFFLQSLNLHPKDVIDKSKPFYQSNLRGADIDPNEWFLFVNKMPELLQFPIAAYRDKFVLCKSYTDILKLQDVQKNSA